MKVSLRWLREFIDLPTEDPSELEQVLVSLGHEVEAVERHLPDWSGVSVGRVESIRPHPSADRVRLVTVTTGSTQREVVCGAWNFAEGAIVAFAPAGSTLAGGVELEPRAIRGVQSAGMVLSERELGLGSDHGGILVLDPDTPIGAPLEDVIGLPDVVLDLKITPNRPDVMSMVGVARELAAYYELPFRTPELQPPTVPGRSMTKVTIADPEGCWRFAGREVSGTAYGASPLWMRRRLQLAGVRPISLVVDVTNYVMIELGQPLHAFDRDRLAGGIIEVRRARGGEMLRTLDGIERALTPDDLVVADRENAKALAGTMGGEDSEVSESTTNVLIEGAAWDPPTVMYMSRRHGLRSEASARFERGVDPNLPPDAVARAALLIIELGGGESPAEPIDEVARAIQPVSIELRLADVTRVLGPGFTTQSVAGLLRRLHMEVIEGEPSTVTVPTYRRDLTRPIDLVEEVARLWGYDRFDETIPTGASGGWTREQKRRRLMWSILTGAGLSQAVNLPFLGAEDLAAADYPEDHEARSTIRIRNPLNEELSTLRTSLLPGLLRSARANTSRGAEAVSLFEEGRVFFNRRWGVDERVPDQPERLAFVCLGPFAESRLGQPPRLADFDTAAGLWRRLATGLGLEGTSIEAASEPGFHPGRTGRVVLAGNAIGFVGEIAPSTAAAYGLEGRVAAAELDLASLLAPPAPWVFAEPSPYPAVDFDLAFELAGDIPVAALVDATHAAGGDFVEDLRVFDVYTGPGLAEGSRSVAIRYRLRSPEATMTGDEAGAVRQQMIVAASALGARLRGAG
jgi:phenylalanyl-tRNA synthetase beta chain